MRTYFINTDAKSNKGKSLHMEWLRRGIGVTSGETKYRSDFSQVNHGDRLLMYVNDIGVVAVGYLEKGEVIDEIGEGKVNPNEPIEYHRNVRWTNDLSIKPVTVEELKKRLFIPHDAIKPIAEENLRLSTFLAWIEQRSGQGYKATGRFTPDRAIAVLMSMRQKCQIDEMTEKDRSQQFYFEPPGAARSLVVSKDLHEGWVRVYINRQSRKLQWFPIGFASQNFRGVEVGYRYLRGHKGLNKRPGIASSVFNIPTLNPLDNNVLLLHCNDEQGFCDLVRWYAGLHSVHSGHPPAGDEISGDGPWSPVGLGVPSDEAVLPPESASPEDFVSLGTEDAVITAGQDIQRDSADPDDPASMTAGAGWMSDPAKRSAVELHAVELACVWYREQGYKVQILGKPFDLLCRRQASGAGDGDELIHVEVKGSVGNATTVRLTRNEVQDAKYRAGWRSDLFVISEIKLFKVADAWVAQGGKQRWYKDWSPQDQDLVATEFEYRLPD